MRAVMPVSIQHDHGAPTACKLYATGSPAMPEPTTTTSARSDPDRLATSTTGTFIQSDCVYSSRTQSSWPITEARLSNRRFGGLTGIPSYPLDHPGGLRAPRQLLQAGMPPRAEHPGELGTAITLQNTSS